nr:NusG domain II-containing protein [Sedimentibacter sp.]
MKRKINKYDISLIILIILISGFFIYYNSKNIAYSNDNRAIIYSENEVVGEYILSKELKDEFTIKTSNGYNTIKIEDGKIWIEDADCPDKYCIHQGKISGDGQVIVCLPNKLMIKIVSDEEDKEIDFIAP